VSNAGNKIALLRSGSRGHDHPVLVAAWRLEWLLIDGQQRLTTTAGKRPCLQLWSPTTQIVARLE
jgi:hypothetical protein